ncbi:MAG: proteasome assembly chaperone family protein [Crenarchaeota archaeon]|nr:proteasome assembly chaperone family protein [Thermoproteota archaeon]
MGVEIVVDVDRRELEGAYFITGFRGFGMIGYLVSKYLALLLGGKKVGYILTDAMPPVVLIEDDGPGYPYDIYLVEDPKTVIVVNRALPEREHTDEYIWGLSEWVSRIKPKLAILVGGLRVEYRPEGEEHGYRYIVNKFYKGPELEAPQMEAGLGVMGPLALLYMHLDYFQVPAAIVLPYTTAEEADWTAAAFGVKLIASKFLGKEVDVKTLEEMGVKQRELIEQLMKMVEEETGKGDDKERPGIYM